MTREHGHLQCDTPGCGAVTPEHSERAMLWQELDARGDAPAAHLCERCVEKRDKGVLADAFYVECARCGRSTRDGVDHWYGAPATPADRDALRGPPPSITVCGDCWREDDSFAI